MTEIAVRMPDSITFKSAKLKEAALEIDAAARTMVNSTVEISKILGRVKAGKLYADDGYKSVGDFAQKVFGISAASAYKMAQVGERFYNTDSKFLREATEGFTTSNLAEMVGVSDDDVLSLVNSGAVTKDTPQAKIREVVAARKGGETKAEIVREYAIDGMLYRGDKALKVSFDRVTMDDFERQFPGIAKKITVPIQTESGRSQYYVICCESGEVIRYSAEKLPIGKPKAVKAPKFTIEQLRAMLAQAEAESGE